MVDSESDGRSYDSSEDDDLKWNIINETDDDPVLPLLNVLSFGWMEDGRCSTYTKKNFENQVKNSNSTEGLLRF